MKRVIVVWLVCLACSSGTAPESVTPASVTVTPQDARLAGLGHTVTLTAVAKDSLGRTVPGTVIWGSSDPQAITVSNRGTTTAIGCGVATITATVANITGTTQAVVYMPPTDPVHDTFAPALGVDLPRMTRLADVLYVQDITAGSGAVVSRGRTVTTRFRMWLPDGTLVQDFSGTTRFTAGSEFTRGWLSEGVVDMRVGGRRRVVAGSTLAWGLSFMTVRCPSTMVAEIEVIA
jgi:hypothetical protein